MILKLLENGGSRLIENVAECRFSRAPVPHVLFKRRVRNSYEGLVKIDKEELSPEERIDLVGDVFVLDARGDSIDRFRIDPRKEGR